ncbi:syndecan-1 isoform X1 [Astyanax mexicanus]|uniref:Syndecan n=1 Tax=Astyanax mexicanus TaxID=7994 RepID=A0A8B9JN72_ASTMX|nr:syndecan-1 isoform X1 [Astyanax mexicanus]
MRIASRTTLLICLFLWIPTVTVSQSADESVDEETSGDDGDFSGSGSGDDVFMTDINETEVATQPNTNMTKTTWVTEAPVKLPEQAVTQLSSTVIPQAGVESASPSTTAPLHSTTNIPETQPSLTSVKSFIHVKDIPEVETTTVQRVEQETPDTVPVEEKLPVLPVTTEQPTTTTTPENVEEEPTSTTSVLLVQNVDDTSVADDIDDQPTEAPDMETTTLPLPTMTGSGNVAAKYEPEPTEASGEPVESTTVQAIVEDPIDANMIPEVNREIDPQEDDDFDFENDISSKTRMKLPESEVALGASTDEGNLLERTEVLAGVIAGGLVGLAFAIMLVALMVYRMKKKDEGSYSLDEHKHPNGGYQKPVAQEEFLA